VRVTAEQDHANRFFELATVYRMSALFFAALELDVFSHIPAEGASTATIAKALDVDEGRLGVLLNPLVGMGILMLRQDGRYALPPAYGPLLKQGPDYRGDQFLRHKEAADDWLRLSTIVRGEDTGSAYYGDMLQGESVRPYLESIRRTNQPHADAMMDRIKDVIPRLRRALDIGGGHGYYAERLLDLNPALTVTVLDVEQSIAYCRDRQQSNPNRDRLELLVGDARTQEIECEYDLVMMNDLLHYFPMPEKANVIRRGARALRPDGILSVAKLRLDATGTRPASSALLSLMVLVNTHTGRLETDAEAEHMMRDAGLSDVHTLHLNDERSLVLGTR
jgi:2-polyprenyl-3-methyl-5-hydroxy-6-metoxy-1,4-benzoquinol methylase